MLPVCALCPGFSCVRVPRFWLALTLVPCQPYAAAASVAGGGGIRNKVVHTRSHGWLLALLASTAGKGLVVSREAEGPAQLVYAQQVRRGFQHARPASASPLSSHVCAERLKQQSARTEAALSQCYKVIPGRKHQSVTQSSTPLPQHYCACARAFCPARAGLASTTPPSSTPASSSCAGTMPSPPGPALSSPRGREASPAGAAALEAAALPVTTTGRWPCCATGGPRARPSRRTSSAAPTTRCVCTAVCTAV